jgi:hypothetical protein
MEENIKLPKFEEFYNNSWFTSNLILLYRLCKEDNIFNIKRVYKELNLNTLMTKNVDTLMPLNQFIINLGNIEFQRNNYNSKTNTNWRRYFNETFEKLREETKKFKYVKNTYSIYGEKIRIITDCGYKVCFYIIYILLKHLLSRTSNDEITGNELIELELDFSSKNNIEEQNTRLHSNNPKNINRQIKKEEEQKRVQNLIKEQEEELKRKEEENKQKLEALEEGINEKNIVVRNVPIDKKGCSCEKLSISSNINEKKKKRNAEIRRELEEKKKEEINKRMAGKEQLQNKSLITAETPRFVNNNNYIINISEPKKIKIPFYKLYLIYCEISGLIHHSEIKVNGVDLFYSTFFWKPIEKFLLKKITFLELFEKEIVNEIPSPNKKNENQEEELYELLNSEHKKKDDIKTKFILIKKNNFPPEIMRKLPISGEKEIVDFLKNNFESYSFLGVITRDDILYSTYFNPKYLVRNINQNLNWNPIFSSNENLLYLLIKNEDNTNELNDQNQLNTTNRINQPLVKNKNNKEKNLTNTA